MGMPRGLIKANAYHQNLSAWEDWRNLSAKMVADGCADLVAKYKPGEGAGWRCVDKAIVAVIKEHTARKMADQIAQMVESHYETTRTQTQDSKHE
jgi:hypothetical protein